MTPKMNCYYWSLARLIGSGGRGDAPQNGHQKIGSIVTNSKCGLSNATNFYFYGSYKMSTRINYLSKLEERRRMKNLFHFMNEIFYTLFITSEEECQLYGIR